MKLHCVGMALIFVSLAFSIGGRAEEKEQPSQNNPATTCAMCKGMMCGGKASGDMAMPATSMPGMSPTMMQQMMAQREKMTTQQAEIRKLLDQLNSGVAAMQKEKKPGALEKKLAEHAALLKQLQAKFQPGAEMPMMGMMCSGMQTGQSAAPMKMHMQNAEQTMGFSQTETTHHFFLKPDGGIIQVEANDPSDSHNRDMVRMHLSHIERALAAGDFSDPMSVHDDIPDGVPLLQSLKKDIHYEFEQTPQGGRVLIRSTNSQAIDAIHAFLRFQIREHQTNDSVTVK